MELYLQECKLNLKNASNTSFIYIVIGNEACDLDSAVSALVFAYFLHKTASSSDIVVPVLNVKRKDLKLRTEVVFYLEETSIPLNDVIYIDEINLKDLSLNERMKLILVDHNQLCPEQSYLEPKITQIIDHHAVENPSRLKQYKTKIEMVGSCCTLIAEEIFNSNESLIDPQIAMLLFGTILLDTICLQDCAKRVTQKDKDIVSKLESYLEGISKEEVFETLQRVKFDVSKLSPEQLLHKDTKYITHNTFRIAIVSLPMLLKEPIKNQEFLSALHNFIMEKHLLSVILLGSEIVSDKTIKRQLAIYAKCPDILKMLSKYLNELENPSLELSAIPCKNSFINLFDQGNSSLTRKFVLPAIGNFLKSDFSSGYIEDDKLSEICTKKDLIMNGLGDHEYSGRTIPLYQAETLDFPNSPNHSSLLNVTVQLQDLTNSSGDSPKDLLDPQKADVSKDMYTPGGTMKRRISVNPDILKTDLNDDDDQKSLSSLSNKSDLDVFSPTDDIILPDDIDTLDEFENSEYVESSCSEPIPEISAAEEFEEERSWKSCFINGEERKIDMKVIDPYRKVLSHGGYEDSTRNAIIVFAACYLPDRNRKDYDYVMDNLFLYVITTLEQLITEDYVLIYLHGATQRSNMPSFGWLKRCYQMIDRRLRKNLKGLYLVHPTFWLKTIVIMTRPFISSKFSRKLKFVYTLQELSSIVPLDQVSIPDKVKQFNEEITSDT